MFKMVTCTPTCGYESMLKRRIKQVEGVVMKKRQKIKIPGVHTEINKLKIMK